MNFKDYCKELEQDINAAYEASVSIEDAEKLAAKFLVAQIRVGQELQTADLDSRMRKTGLKAIKAAVYLDKATETDRKPSDVMLQAYVDRDAIVSAEQQAFDEAEVQRDHLERWLSVCKEAHIYMRSISRGRFE